MTGEVTELEFNTPKDIENFRPGDVVQHYVKDCTSTLKDESEGPENAFNGVTTGKAWYTTQGTLQIFEPAGGIAATKFEVYFRNPAGYTYLKINDVAIPHASLSDGVYSDLTSYLTDGVFYKLEAKRDTSSPGIFAFKVDDTVLIDEPASIISTDPDDSKMVVDGGEWAVDSGIVGQEYRWSDYVTISTGDYYPSDPPTLLFDGSTSTGCNPADKNATITFTPPVPIDYTSKVEFYKAGTASGEYSVNGESPPVTWSAAQGWKDLAVGSGSITSISWNGKGSYPALAAIRVDGIILIDAPAGDTKVTGPALPQALERLHQLELTH